MAWPDGHKKMSNTNFQIFLKTLLAVMVEIVGWHEELL